MTTPSHELEHSQFPDITTEEWNGEKGAQAHFASFEASDAMGFGRANNLSGFRRATTTFAAMTGMRLSPDERRDTFGEPVIMITSPDEATGQPRTVEVYDGRSSNRRWYGLVPDGDGYRVAQTKAMDKDTPVIVAKGDTVHFGMVRGAVPQDAAENGKSSVGLFAAVEATHARRGARFGRMFRRTR